MWLSTEDYEYRKVMWLSTKGSGSRNEVCMAIDERYMRLPSSLWGPFALISTRSGTRLVEYLAKCRRSQMSPRETCQPHIAVGWQVIEKILENERILRQTLWIYFVKTKGTLGRE